MGVAIPRANRHGRPAVHAEAHGQVGRRADPGEGGRAVVGVKQDARHERRDPPPSITFQCGQAPATLHRPCLHGRGTK